MAQQLSRELLRWIQSLDLAYSIKNPKRDFANGFLVAEILSRYFDKEIQMHSYDNGTGIPVRKDNWEQLEKFFYRQRLGELVDKQTVDKIIHNETGAAIGFLNKLYEFLTKRKVQEPPPPPDNDDIPAFARPTASQVMHDAMKRADMQENADLDTAEAALKESMSSHLENLQAERSADPDRFNAIGKTPSKILRGPTRTVGMEEASMAQVQVKEVKVNQISDGNVARLRANKEGRAGASRAALNESGSRAGYSGATVVSILDECVQAVLGDHPIMDAFTIDSSENLISAFILNVTSRGQDLCPEPLAAAVFQKASGQARQLAAICLDNPKELWEAIPLFSSILEQYEESSPIFASATSAMVDLGEQMVNDNAEDTQELFKEIALQTMSGIISSSAEKRPAILKILYAFCAQDISAHITLIKDLQKSIAEMPTFIHALTILIFMERQMNDVILDLYLYYCLIGVSGDMPSSSLKAASIAMLTEVAAYNVSMAAEMLPKLRELTEQEEESFDSWEIHSQLLVVCSALLLKLSPGSEHAVHVYAIVESILSSSNSEAVCKIGLAYLAKNVETHPAIQALYLNALVSLPRESNDFVLGDGPYENIAVAGAPGGKFRIYPLKYSPGFSGLAVAQQLATVLKLEQPEHMEVEQMRALLACLSSPRQGSVFATDMPEWEKVFVQVRDYVFVALCDAECCDLALCILREFVLRSDLQAQVLQEPTFLGSLRLLYPMEDGADEGCQTKVAGFFNEMFDSGEPYATAVMQLLDKFAENHPEQFKKSVLKPLHTKLSS